MRTEDRFHQPYPTTGKYAEDDSGGVFPIFDLFVWAELLETRDRGVAFHRWFGAEISTIFLASDQNHMMAIFGHHDAVPILYETMVFGGWLDCEYWRYETRARAIEGHAHVLRLVIFATILAPCRWARRRWSGRASNE